MNIDIFHKRSGDGGEGEEPYQGTMGSKKALLVEEDDDL